VEVLIGSLYKAGIKQCQDPIAAIKLLVEVSFQFMNANSDLIQGMHIPGNIQLHDVVTYTVIREVANEIRDIIILGNEKGVFHCKFPEKMAKTFTYGILLAVHDDTDFIMSQLDQEKDFVIYAISTILGIDEEQILGVF